MTPSAKTFTLTLALLLCLVAAQVAQASTAYIALPGTHTVGPVSYKTQISITNSGDERAALESLQLEPGVDGTRRDGLRPNRLLIAPNKTFVLRPDPGARGLMELGGAAGFRYSARLVGSNGFTVDLPVITAESRGREDETLMVQGLGGSGTTDLVVMNLGATAASCSASLSRADGTYAIEPVEISILPLSHLVLADFLRGNPGLADARAEVSCSNEFYAYALTSDAGSGQLRIAGPSRSSDTLESLFDKVVTPSVICANGRAICEMPGLVHVSTKAVPVLFIGMTPPVDTYKILRAHVEVLITGWNKTNIHGAHGALYLIVNRNKSLLGSIFFRGPGSNNVTLRHGVCPNGGCLKSKVERGLLAELGTTYVLEYEYNVAAKTTNMRVFHNDLLVAQVQDKPNVNNIFIHPGDKVIIGLSNPNVNSREEPASLGWQYSNLKVEFIR